jgi:hypothetical protein
MRGPTSQRADRPRCSHRCVGSKRLGDGEAAALPPPLRLENETNRRASSGPLVIEVSPALGCRSADAMRGSASPSLSQIAGTLTTLSSPRV